MGQKPKILAFAGSLRNGSWNHKLIAEAVNLARNTGAEVKKAPLG